MPARPAYAKFAPEAYKAMLALETYIHHCSLPQPLAHLIKLRASQINGCAYCIDMHWKDLRALGEPEHRLYALDAWRESPFYSEQERAALAWAEAVTNISTTHADDEIYNEVRPFFTDQQLADLTIVLSTINAWNRLAISGRAEPGHYKSSLKPETAVSATA
jgi:AhpD family alkylhydroperoxidase